MPGRQIPHCISGLAAPAAVFLILMGAVTAHADSGESKLKPAAMKPDSTSSAFGDWTARCRRSADGAMACEAAQYVHLPNQRQPAAQIILRRSGADWSMTIEVAPDVTLSNTMSIDLGMGATPTDMQWVRCQPSACAATAQLPAAVIDPWKTFTGKGSFSFLSASGQKILFPVSPHGLSEAVQSFPQT